MVSKARTQPSQPSLRTSCAGFTLIELLVVLAIIVVLAGLLFPALASSKSQVRGVCCLNNLRQVQAAMFLYAADNDDFVAWNFNYVKHSWVCSGDYGRAAPDARGCTNVQWLIDREYAAFADYIKTPSTYKCPSDKTVVPIDARRHPWVRSYGASFIQRKMTDFENNMSLEGTPVPPTMNYTFNEPHPGYLVGLLAAGAEIDAFAEFPAYWHNGAAGFAFADGHVELHRWIDARTRRPLDDEMPFDSSGSSKLVRSPNNADVHWLCQRSASGIGYGRQDMDIVHALAADPSIWLQ